MTRNEELINDWAPWRALLRGENIARDPNTPFTGYYRMKQGSEWVPVAYWYDSTDGHLRCQRGKRELHEHDAVDMWPYVSRHPVTPEAYETALATGQWPDEHPAVVGHNRAPVEDDWEAIRDRIEDLTREAGRLIEAGAATTDDAVNQASDLAQTLGELEARAVSLHQIEKAPHLEAGRAIDKKWFGLRDLAADFKRRLKAAVITPWLTRKAEQAQAEASKAIASGTAPEALPTVRTTAGTSKRSTALRTQTSAEVTDWQALLYALHEHPDLRETAQKIANASAKVGVALPGTKIVKKQTAA